MLKSPRLKSTLAPLAIIVCFACVVSSAAFAAQISVVSVISQKFGKAQEEVAGISPSDPEYSPFLPCSVPAFCVSETGNGTLYLLDAANGRVKKFNLEGNFIGLLPLEGIPRNSGLRGITVTPAGGTGDPAVIVHSDDSVFRFPPKGGKPEKITAEGISITRIFATGEKDYLIYDSSKHALIRAEAANGKFRTTWKADGVCSPWPAGDGKVYSIYLPSFDECRVFILGSGNDSAPREFFRLSARDRSRISRPAPIGVDSAGNVYLSYFSNNAQTILALTPAGKVFNEFALDPKFTSGRSAAYCDEAIGHDGSLYIGFVDSDRFYIQKFVSQK